MMDNIVIAGNMNEEMDDIAYALETQFKVRRCAAKSDIIEGMLQVSDPKLVILNLEGLHVHDEKIFRDLSVLHESLPVLTIGSETEKHRFLRFYNKKQFEHITNPVDINGLIITICNILGYGFTEKTGRIFIQKPSAKKSVLVVDDNPMLLKSVKEMLEGDYEIYLAQSVLRAMASIGKRRPDIILLDYEMPICDGKQTLEMIRADEELKNTPVIFLTSICDKKHIASVIGLKPAGYLLKPPVRDRLVETIENALNV